MKKTFIKYGSAVAGALMPVLAMAATINTSYIDGLILVAKSYLNAAVAIIIFVAFVYFLYGLVKYVVSGGDGKKRAEAVGVITTGIIVLAVMVSVWGLVSIVRNAFGVDNNNTQLPSVPQIN